MVCRHCKKQIPADDLIAALEKLSLISPVDRVRLTRQFLIEWLTAWRKEHGKPGTDRALKNRSTAQLRKMYEQAVAGETYRVGRRWRAATQS